jgi:hypothetical protein
MTREIGLPLITLPNPSTKELEWWADVEGIPTQWEIQEEVLFCPPGRRSGRLYNKRARTTNAGRLMKRARKNFGVSTITTVLFGGFAVLPKKFTS